MEKTNSIIILLIIGLVIFALGAGGGFYYQYYQDNSKIQQADKISSELDSLSSSIVTAVAAFGKVSAINGRNVLLAYNGKSLAVNIGDGVSITSYVSAGTTAGKKAQFSDIKIGDNLSIALKIEKDGKLTAQTVLILSSGSNDLPQQ